MSRPARYPPPFRASAVERVRRARSGHASTTATIKAVAAELGINAATLRGWVHQAEIDSGHRDGTTTAERQELFRLRIEHAALRRALDKVTSTGGHATSATGRATQAPGPTSPQARADQPTRAVAAARVDQLGTARSRPQRRVGGSLSQDGTEGDDGIRG